MEFREYLREEMATEEFADKVAGETERVGTTSYRCPSCGNIVKIPATLKAHPCPVCGFHTLPCWLCERLAECTEDLTECDAFDELNKLNQER